MVLFIFKGGIRNPEGSRNLLTFLKYSTNRWASGHMRGQKWWAVGWSNGHGVSREREQTLNTKKTVMVEPGRCCDSHNEKRSYPGEKEGSMVEQDDKRALSNSRGPSDAGAGLLRCPRPGLRVASEGAEDSELQGIVSDCEERAECCSWMAPGQGSVCPTFL